MVRVKPGHAAGVSVLLVLAWLALWLVIDTPGDSIPGALAVAVAWVPLLPAVPGLFRGSRRAAGWSALAGVFYEGFAVMEVVANPASRAWAAVAVALIFLMISAQVRMLRTRSCPGGVTGKPAR